MNAHVSRLVCGERQGAGRALGACGGKGALRAFSLLEVTLAMAIAAVALVALIGLLPSALRSSREGIDQTAIGAVLEDVHDRLKGSRLEEGTPEISPLFYDQQGRFWDASDRRRKEGSMDEDRFFRVDLALAKDPKETAAPGAENLHTAMVAISWPVDVAGQPLGPGNPKTHVSYRVAALTGRDWLEIDPGFEEAVEY